MPNQNSEFWDKRYASVEFVYGNQPNEQFKEYIDKALPGELLLPGEGEGRNAIYAAGLGWQVDAFDLSRVARDKAFERAEEQGVTFNYTIGDINEIKIPTDKYDLAALINFHLHKDIRAEIHNKIIRSLRKGGVLLYVGFSRDQLKNNTGGPKSLDMLVSLEDVLDDFRVLDTISIKQTDVQLDAGEFHKGVGNIIYYLGIKM